MEELLEGVEPPARRGRTRSLRRVLARSNRPGARRAAGSTGAGVAATRPRDGTMVSLARRRAAGRRRRPSDRARSATARSLRTSSRRSIHPQSGKLSIVRVLSGTIKSDATLTDISAKRRESAFRRPLPLARQETRSDFRGRSRHRSSQLRGLEAVKTGDTLTSNGHKVLLPRVPLDEPVFAMAIKPKERIDEAKIFADARAHRRGRSGAASGSRRHHERISSTRQRRTTRRDCRRTLERASTKSKWRRRRRRFRIRKRSRQRHGNALAVQTPDRRPRTVRRRVAALRAARTRKRSQRSSEKIVGGVVPRQFIPAVEKGVREALTARAERLSGYRHSRDALRRSVPRRRLERTIVQNRGRHGRARRASEVPSRGAGADLACNRHGPDHPDVFRDPTAHRQARPDSRDESRPSAPASTWSRPTSRRSSCRATLPNCVRRRRGSGRSARATSDTIRFRRTG